MTNTPRFNDAAAIAAVNAVGPLLNSGLVSVYTGVQPAVNGALSGTLLASMAFGTAAFAAASASAGTVTAAANAISNGTAVATGTAGTAGTDLILSTVSLALGNIVSCSSLTITQPES